MPQKIPEISVVMPVYNAGHFLEAAIRSVLSQTFSAFELIIIDDGSTDGSWDVITSFNDPRIVPVRQQNAGLATTLNRGVAMAKAQIIARMDNDDVCLPDRFKRQFEFMQGNPSVALCGVWAEIINERGEQTGRFLRHPANSARLAMELLFNNPFVHAGVMFRKKAFDAAGGYSTDPRFFEDHHLWSEIGAHSKLANLPEVLVQYREVKDSMSRSTSDYAERVINQSVLNLGRYAPGYRENDLRLFARCMNGVADEEEFIEAVRMCGPLLDAVTRNMAAHTGIHERSLRSVADDFSFQLKRHYLNCIIQSEHTGILQKAIARMRRKVLFTRFGE
jgi:glycosyltransferase involved in cell wall biosynthesis